MQTIKYAIISAAGLGSRLGLNMPKCLVKINDRAIIDYQLELLKDVENVRVVVGFMEDDVIDYVKSIRDDVLFVRNPYFSTTSNCFSLYLATYDIKEEFVTIDGDLLIPRKSFRKFKNEIKKGQSLIGITKSKTEDAVFVDYDEKTGKIKEFRRDINFGYEWSGLANLSKIKINKESQYIYHILEQNLPLLGCEIECFEIDTPADLKLARDNFVF